MFRTLREGFRSSGSAISLVLAAALATGGCVGSALAADKKPAAPKANYSKEFVKAAVPFDKALNEAEKRGDVVAARANLTAATNAYNSASGSSARKAAAAQRDAALAALGATLAPEKNMLAALAPVATTEDDKLLVGNYTARLGQMSQDVAMIRKGYEAMLASGRYPAAEVPKLQNEVGTICYDLKDYACVQTQMTAALQGGYKNANTEILLADSYLRSNQVAQGLDVLSKAIESRKASGSPVPDIWYATALNAAYKAKMLDRAAGFSQGMVSAYPTPENWASATNTLRYLGNYENQERIDILRLMARTGSLNESDSINDYIQIADKLRYPAEELSVVEAGLKAGKLEPADVFVTEARTSATKLVNDEKPTLGAMEARAKAPAAELRTIVANADALLSYGQSAAAESLFALALQKPGVDADRVLTRMGIAQIDQGKFADAQTTFAKVGGLRKPIAQLWAIYAAKKAAGN